MTEELLVNFKNLMQRWFPLTSTVNNRFTDVMNKAGINFSMRDGDVIALSYSDIQYTDVPTDGWVYSAIEGLFNQDTSGDSIPEEIIMYSDVGVIIYENKFFFKYDQENKTLDLLNKYHVNLEASNYNPSIDSTITLTANITDEFGNPIPFYPLTLKKNGSSLSQGITNNVGMTTFTYSCFSIGLQCFSINDSNIFVNIAGEAYPVGSIYMSVNSTNPNTLFGGSWERLKDRFLLASGDTYSNGSTGGSATVRLTQSQMPRHNHTTNAHTHYVSESGEYFVTSEKNGASNTRVTYSASGNRYVDGMLDNTTPFHHRTATGSASPTTKYAGGTGTSESASNGASHENMPPYLTVFMWKRIA